MTVIRSLSFVLCAAGIAAGCSGAGDADVEVTSDTAYATSAVFGDGADDGAIVATVGGRAITVGHVAAWLRLYPTLTVEQAVADLVDANAVLATADESELSSTRAIANDARRLALAWRWVRGALWEVDGLREADPAEVEAWATSDERATLFGSPELRTVSHLLVKPPEDPSDEQRAEARALASDIYERVMALGRRVSVDDFNVIVDEWGELPDGFEFVVNAHFAFPQRYSGESRWGGAERVYDEFADAAFETPVGEVVGPVETTLGAHVIVVEQALPAAWFDPGRRAELAESIPLAQARTARFAEEMRRIGQAATVVNHPDNIGVLAMSADERLQSEVLLRSSRIR